ncbi:LacI family DNA-binding transcriptional regulator [Aurantimonas marina]|uniref:LacI family DNA-binding transcriptional regulator n=1 Tax=Aurantimonas marina TaxID=2780508 RepID=UPI0019D14F19|nr:LacI family DNA-binding transcriptional regulator [Aurantimonas marina]
MNERSAPTLADVAQHAGVSTATVSRCLNSPERVLPETRQRVIQAVEQLGYTPNFGGWALASNRTNTVGAIIPTMENAIFARGLQAFQEALAAAGVTLLVASTGYDPDREAEQIKALVGRGADGLLLIGTARPQATYDFLRQRSVPYVIAWSHRANDGNCYAGFDNRNAARALAERVIGYGHRAIAMIAGETQGNDRAADRVAGVRDAVTAAGMDAGATSVVEAPYSLEEGGDAFAALMRRNNPPSAVICGNDVLAVGAMTKAREIGLSIPRDVSIVGFDDIDLALVVQPQLTTVHVPHRRMGEAAARLLLQLRDGHPNVESTILETHIVERGSLIRYARQHREAV